jgi:hypothetical protein
MVAISRKEAKDGQKNAKENRGLPGVLCASFASLPET